MPTQIFDIYWINENFLFFHTYIQIDICNPRYLTYLRIFRIFRNNLSLCTLVNSLSVSLSYYNLCHLNLLIGFYSYFFSVPKYLLVNKNLYVFIISRYSVNRCYLTTNIAFILFSNKKLILPFFPEYLSFIHFPAIRVHSFFIY